MPETKDLILRKAVIEDWQAMLHNIWCHSESAKYMAWSNTYTDEDAKARMERTIAFQAAHDYHWTVVEKASGEAIGWAGMQEETSGVFCETGVALGPNFTGKGYGTQILHFLTDYAQKTCGAKRFLACCNKENWISKKLLDRCGFQYTHSEEAIHHRDQIPYTLDYYVKELSSPMENTTITLRSFLPSDKEQMLDILTDKTVGKTYMLPDYTCREDATALFERLMGLSLGKDRFVRCISLGETAIGFLNEVEIKDGQIELGYVIHPQHQGKGYMTTALKLAIAALHATGWYAVICGAFEHNAASLRVMEKAGMKRIDYTDTVEYRGTSYRCIYYEARQEENECSNTDA